jgi:hypothetical protein
MVERRKISCTCRRNTKYTMRAGKNCEVTGIVSYAFPRTGQRVAGYAGSIPVKKP